MPRIDYVQQDGTTRTVDVPVGYTVMEGARDAGIKGMVAECGGACSCSTCHVYVAPGWAGRMPPVQAMEEDMLDFAWEVDRQRSRLSCRPGR